MVKFSIITPTLLRPTLNDTIACIDQQTYPHWEHLIVIDVPGVRFPSTDPRRRVLVCRRRHRNYGNTCRTQAFDHVTGNYLLYLDDDDTFRPNCLQTLAEHIQNYENKRGAPPTWGVFRIQYGPRIFPLQWPPQWGHICSNQFFHRPIIHGVEYRYATAGTKAIYEADWFLIKRLLPHSELLLINKILGDVQVISRGYKTHPGHTTRTIHFITRHFPTTTFHLLRRSFREKKWGDLPLAHFYQFLLHALHRKIFSN